MLKCRSGFTAPSRVQVPKVVGPNLGAAVIPYMQLSKESSYNTCELGLFFDGLRFQCIDGLPSC
jgi:hypothetical protein